jgi:hypothetical protein
MKKIIKAILRKAGYQIKKITPEDNAAPEPENNLKQEEPQFPERYDSDGLSTVHNHDFMKDPAFINAYQRGIKAAGGSDYSWYWRVYTGLWAAANAGRLEGDFVECGVNYGFMSSAIMQSLNWDSLNKNFYLLDTFNGMDRHYITDEEMADGVFEKGRKLLETGFYVSEKDIEIVRNNFSEWKNSKIIQGSIPETLSEVDTQKIAFLHLDMNCSVPEVEALKYFWPFITEGGIILLDDYGYFDFDSLRLEIDKFAKSININILSLPTGQGLIIKHTRNNQNYND